MAWPSFAPGSGPFPDAAGRWSTDPAGLSAPERTAAASLYAALMTATCLDLLGASGRTTVEGPFAHNALFVEALARLTGRPLLASPGLTGTSSGAAGLFADPGRQRVVSATQLDRPDLLSESFIGYAARWRDHAGR